MCCKPEAEVLADKFKLDFFEIVGSMPAAEAFRSRAEWESFRTAAKKQRH